MKNSVVPHFVDRQTGKQIVSPEMEGLMFTNTVQVPWDKFDIHIQAEASTELRIPLQAMRE